MRINSLEQMGVGWGIEDDYPTAVTDVEGTGCIGRVVDKQMPGSADRHPPLGPWSRTA